MRRLSRKLRWPRRQNARRSCESAFCETFVKIAIRCTGCARMLLSGYHGCRVLCRCGDSHACGGSQGSVPPECETFVISGPRLPRGYRLFRAPKVGNVSQNWRKTGFSGALELYKTSRLCANPALCRALAALRWPECETFATRHFRLFLAHDGRNLLQSLCFGVSEAVNVKHLCANPALAEPYMRLGGQRRDIQNGRHSSLSGCWCANPPLVEAQVR